MLMSMEDLLYTLQADIKHQQQPEDNKLDFAYSYSHNYKLLHNYTLYMNLRLNL